MLKIIVVKNVIINVLLVIINLLNAMDVKTDLLVTLMALVNVKMIVLTELENLN